MSGATVPQPTQPTHKAQCIRLKPSAAPQGRRVDKPDADYHAMFGPSTRLRAPFFRYRSRRPSVREGVRVLSLRSCG